MLRSEWVAVACNAAPNVMDWGIGGWVAYGGSCHVVLYEPSQLRVQTLVGHRKSVSAVRWIPRTGQGEDALLGQPEQEIVSGSTDGQVIVWRRKHRVASASRAGAGFGSGADMNADVGTADAEADAADDGAPQVWEEAQRFTLPADTTALAACAHPVLPLTYIAAAAADGSVTVLRRDGGMVVGDGSAVAEAEAAAPAPAAAAAAAAEDSVASSSFRVVATLRPDNASMRVAQTLSLVFVPSDGASLATDCMLALGCIDGAVHMYVLSDGDGDGDGGDGDGSVAAQRAGQLSGHTDWVRGLDACRADDGALWWASAAQDGFVWLWRALPWAQEQAAAARDGGLRAASTRLRAGRVDWAAAPHALLIGHDDWVYSVRWQRPQRAGDRWTQPMALLSASMDRSMLLWRPDAQTGLWVVAARFGDTGGTALGLYGACLRADGAAVMGHGFRGALQHWAARDGVWRPQVAVSGHGRAVEDAAWDPRGRYLVTVSLDQTTRVWARWLRPGHRGPPSWHELARAQVHGYDLRCVAFVAGAEHRFASGADEKVVRVFDAPQPFVEALAAVAQQPSYDAPGTVRPAAVRVPVLGLVNRAGRAGGAAAGVEGGAAGAGGGGDDDGADGDGDAAAEAPATTAAAADDAGIGALTAGPRPPLEQRLLQDTLWAEADRLYGHGYELAALACAPDGRVLASAAQSASAAHAAIRLWDPAALHRSHVLPAVHKLTVTQLAFSPDDGRRLLAVSRDRAWSLWQRGSTALDYTLVERADAHARIVYGCAWSPDGACFATASRDGTVKVWGAPATPPAPLLATLAQPAAATAVEWLRIGQQHVLVIGLETGALHVWRAVDGDSRRQWTLLCSADVHDCHADEVRRIRCAPGSEDSAEGALLASCSADGTLRLLRLRLDR